MVSHFSKHLLRVTWFAESYSKDFLTFRNSCVSVFVFLFVSMLSLFFMCTIPNTKDIRSRAHADLHIEFNGMSFGSKRIDVWRLKHLCVRIFFFFHHFLRSVCLSVESALNYMRFQSERRKPVVNVYFNNSGYSRSVAICKRDSNSRKFKGKQKYK